eukprot:jgi/Chlat1/1782/Chrsp134S02104
MTRLGGNRAGQVATIPDSYPATKPGSKRSALSELRNKTDNKQTKAVSDSVARVEQNVGSGILGVLRAAENPDGGRKQLSQSLSAALRPNALSQKSTELVAVPAADNGLAKVLQLPVSANHGGKPPASANNTILGPLDDAPFDWSLKTSVRFTSQEPFDWCRQISPDDECLGVQSFVASGKVPASSRPAQLARALLSWAHPATVLPPSVRSSVTAHSTTPAEKSWLASRQRAWEDALRSLYYMTRKGRCSCFLYTTTQFSAVFRAAGVSGTVQCTAVITRSTKGLRNQLREHDVTFTMPLCDARLDDPVALLELKEMEQTKAGQMRYIDAAVALDNSPVSMLSLQGARSVHALFDFLLNYRSLVASFGAMSDVPELHAPVAFVNASMRHYQVQCNVAHSLGSNAPDPALGDATANGKIHTMVLEKQSCLPPWVVHRLCTMLRDQHDGDFSASFAHDSQSHVFNEHLNQPLSTPSVTPSSGQDGQNGGSFSEEELACWRHKPIMQAAVIKQLQCTQGQFNVVCTKLKY